MGFRPIWWTWEREYLIMATNQVIDYPAEPQMGWGGYYNRQDPTVLPPNVLTSPSLNCLVPDGDLIIPRKGSLLLGTETVEDFQVIGHLKKFTSAQGNVFEIKVFPTDVGNPRGDVVRVLYLGDWYTLTEAVNPFDRAPIGHRYFFDSWWDQDPNKPAQLRVDLARAVWVNGTDKIFSWTGSVVQVLAITANTITIDAATYTDWATQGFIDPAVDPSIGADIIVNGVRYTITAGWGTNVVTVASTAGISPGDYVFAAIRQDIPLSTSGSGLIFDMCRMVKNHMHYSNWATRNVYVSNAFNKQSLEQIIGVSAVQNDLLLTGTFTGTGNHIFNVVIDEVNPDVNEQTFQAGGPDSLNDARFVTSGYTDLGDDLNVYKVVVVANFTIITTDADVLNLTPGEVLQGQTSGAMARFVSLTDAGGGQYWLALDMITIEQFEVENILSLESGQTIESGNIQARGYQSWIEGYKNNVQLTIISAIFTGIIVPLDAIPTSIDLNIDGLTIEFGNFSGHAIGDTFILNIRQGGVDYFVWRLDNGVLSASTAITGADQLLQDGVTIRFANVNGHTLGDKWDIGVVQSVTFGWLNFFSTFPLRKPGEGFTIVLPSNFWTMAPQETEMYLNTQAGEWLFEELVLSADLTSETINVQPLKETSQNKAIYPYMIGYIDNNLAFVNERKMLKIIGRKDFVELPQLSNLSDPVKKDFEALTFEDGSMEFWDEKLWITSPRQSRMLCFDLAKKYWQPPQEFPENGILSIVGDSLISHSHIRNITNTLFVGINDNGNAFNIKIRLPYNAYGNRWRLKTHNFSFIEGYIIGNTKLTYRVYLDPGGCTGIQEHIVDPIICITPDRAPIGEGSQGSHPLGSDMPFQDNYFHELYKEPLVKDYYFASIEVACQSLDAQFSILSLGLNSNFSPKGNNNITSNIITVT